MLHGWWAWPLLMLVAGRALLHARRLARLADQPPAAAPPTLSIVVPACNEAATLAPALTQLLATRYPGLEVIVVDDRSTDGTGALVDRFASLDPRVVPVHVQTLPPGWLGKVNALEQGRRIARGDWLLFTDADIHFGPEALQKAVGHCQARGLDHLSVAPRFRDRPLALQACLINFAVSMMSMLDPHELDKPVGDTFAGVGAFNLVRRQLLDDLGGLGWLRMEVVDDGGLALLLYEAGARSGFLGGVGEVELDWYGSLGGLVRGLEKNIFSMVRYSLGRALGLSLALLLVVAGVAASVADAATSGATGLAALAACYAVVTLLYGATAGRVGLRRAAAPFAVFGFVVFVFTLARAIVLTLRQGGITWRGTLYPLEELRAMHRVILPPTPASRAKRAAARALPAAL